MNIDDLRFRLEKADKYIASLEKRLRDTSAHQSIVVERLMLERDEARRSAIIRAQSNAVLHEIKNQLKLDLESARQRFNPHQKTKPITNKTMQITLPEIIELTGKSTAKNPAAKRDLGTQIVVADRGFVYVGKTVIEGEFVTVTNARNIRVWGTTKGLGEIVGGPTSQTKLDKVGQVLIPMKAVIHFITCTRDW